MESLLLNRSSPSHYFTEIVDIHINEIHHGFLPLLGADFLFHFYYEIIDIDGSILWVVIDKGKVIGFVLGTTNLNHTYNNFLLRKSLKLFPIIIKSLVKRGVFRKALGGLFYSFNNKITTTEKMIRHPGDISELLSIAVATGEHGRGVGKLLVQLLEKSIIECNKDDPYLYVSTNSVDVISNSFYQKLGFQKLGVKKHNNLILSVYRKKLSI